jgi:Lar family restriction alleviation protein
MADLLPCPFCGNSSDLIVDGYQNRWVCCDGCGAQTSEFGSETDEQAIAKWNCRTPPAPQAMPPVTLPEPACWTLTEILDKRETTYRALLWFSNPVNCAWSALYTADQLLTAIADDRKLRGGA